MHWKILERILAHLPPTSLIVLLLHKDLHNVRSFQKILVWLLFLMGSGCATDSGLDSKAPSEPLFKKIPPSVSGVDFVNTLSEHPSPNRNELLFEYFSNGAGVAVGDLNQDGFDDLFFTANMGYNRLYLNEGDLRFRDISDFAGIKGRVNTWKTGVAMADINGDGLLDIYVCYSGDLPADRRVDEVYINQGLDGNGMPFFEEQAQEYGLAQSHSSNQPYFFDYDLDGDLDLFLLTHNVERIQRLVGKEAIKELAIDDPMSGVRLYRNDGFTFVDATRESGISSSSMTYGLGAGISDVNNDGWMDIYVGNDYFPPDYLYINQKDGTFRDELGARMTLTSRASMGIDIADVNNDGWTDIIVLDMLPEDPARQKTLFVPDDRRLFDLFVESGFHHQYTRNTLQLNVGSGHFSEVGQLAGISNTDWSWAVLATDFDNDGLKDVFITNGTLHDTIDRDYLAFQRQFIRLKDQDLEPADVGLLMERMPSVDLENYIFRNENGLQFEDYTVNWGLGGALKTTGAAYSDLDNDGDLDLVTHNLNEYAFIYENQANTSNQHAYIQFDLAGLDANTFGIGAKVFIYTQGQKQLVEQSPMRGYLSSVSPVLHAGLGAVVHIDSVEVLWPQGRRQVLREVAVNQRLLLSEEAASIGGAEHQESYVPYLVQGSSPVDFVHEMPEDIDDFTRQPLLVHPMSDVGPALAKADVNADGLEDLFVGGGMGQASRIYFQKEDGEFDEASVQSFELHAAHQDVSALFFDYDGDNDMDLYVVSGGYANIEEGAEALQDRVYQNDGSGIFSYAPDALPEMRTSTSVVRASDVNQDGFVDLFVGGYVVPGRFPEVPRSYMLLNNGQGGFTDETLAIAEPVAHTGMVTDAVWGDLNRDNIEELIVVGQWMPIKVYGFENDEWVDHSSHYFDRPYAGLWNTVELVDVNNDTIPDIVAGNVGKNTQFNASFSEPVTLFSADFDNNGVIDPLLSYYIHGEMYLYATLEELQQQLPLFASRFESHSTYGQMTAVEVIGEERIASATRFELNELETSLFTGQKGGPFQKEEVPVEVQFAPVYTITAVDINQDEVLDLIMAGNTTEGTIRLGKYDASYGTLLLGGSTGVSFVPPNESGLLHSGPIREAVLLGEQVVFAEYDGPLRKFNVGGAH